MKIAIAQINPTVGDLHHNSEKIKEKIQDAKRENADLVLFPEMCLTGYPPKDLVLKKSFISASREYLSKINSFTKDICAIVGFINQEEENLYNAAAIIQNRKILKVYHKIHLPNYDVFDEKRYFKPGQDLVLFEFKGIKIGVTICEDIWVDNGPIGKLRTLGSDLIVNISASPFHAGKASMREELISRRAREHKISIIYANMVGAQDDLIFDGRSYFFNKAGEKIVQAKAFQEDLTFFSLNEGPKSYLTENVIGDIFDALVLGVRDYIHKNKFNKVIIGLSGGIDSAITAAIAVEALGKENVIGVTMPSKFSSTGSLKDSQQLAENLGIEICTIPIKEGYETYLKSLEPLFKGTSFGIAEENIQARIRGNILMALSNKFGYLVLTTGNKSELSVGYATLYGDMAGGLAVISDLLKTRVYELAHYLNTIKRKEIIPDAILTKEPSAELRENQKDTDSLPEYPVLDPILQAYIEEEKSKEEIVSLGFPEEIVSNVIKMVDRNEYKRQQAALGLRITPRAFGSGRRMPITNGWGE